VASAPAYFLTLSHGVQPCKGASKDQCSLAGSLWQVLCAPVPDEVCKPHALGQTMPHAGGRAADSVGKWESFQGQMLTSWLSLNLIYLA